MLIHYCCKVLLLVSLASASLPLRHSPIFSLSSNRDGGPSVPASQSKSKSSKPTKIVESFRVRSDIRFRFATTQMSSVVRNVAENAQEIGFDVTLPKNAFIMDFYMTIDGKRYDGQVKERKEAKRQYQEAVDRGQSAGHVRQAPRHANVFEVSVNVAAGSAVNFTLTYQEVLRRRLGVYEHEIHVNPGQPVEDFRIEVYIQENRPLKFVKTPALRKDYLLTNKIRDADKQNEMTIVDRPSPDTATILYEPSLGEQGKDGGISARFAVQYDVEHAGPKGDVLVVDGYFVHFMVPDGLTQTLPKDIIFVLDVSGSMYGAKIQQLRVAMRTILSDLQPNDRFNIITFSSGASKWKEGLVVADENNVATAQSFVNTMQANGMTNINDALLTALSEMKNRHERERVGMIFFLTDGHPTEGETRPEEIAKNVMNANERTVAIFSLAFGNAADYDSLKSMSAQNLGFSRKIYEASDADLQVSSLYDEISAVSIKDMSIKYQNSSVDEFSLTDTEFPIVFNGTEIVICGLLKEHTKTLQYEITGLESEGEIDITAELDSVDTMIITEDTQRDQQLYTGSRDFSGMVERMWAYQTIRQLLRQKEKYAGDIGKVKQLDKRILELSLKYKFVTPLTSMVVTKPDQGETVMHKADISAERSIEQAPLRSAQVQSKVGKLFSDPLQSSRKSYQGSVHRSMADPGLHQIRRVVSGNRSSFRNKLSKTSFIGKTGTTTTTTTAPLNRKRSTLKAKPAVQKRKTHSVLKLVTVTKQNSTGVATKAEPYLCVVPKGWRFGKVSLIRGPGRMRVLLRLCPKRQCKKRPSLKSLVFSVGGKRTEVFLEGNLRWHYRMRHGSKFSVSVMTNQKLHVSGPGLNATVEWTLNGRVAEYKVGFLVSSTASYSGVIGKLSSQSPGQLNRQGRKKALKVCESEGSNFSVLVPKRLIKQLNSKKHSRSRKNRKSRRQ